MGAVLLDYEAFESIVSIIVKEMLVVHIAYDFIK